MKYLKAKEATAKKVSKFIYEKIIYRHKYIEKILINKENYFNNQMILHYIIQKQID